MKLLPSIEILELIVFFFKRFRADENHFEILINDKKIIFELLNQLTSNANEKKSLFKIIDRSKKEKKSKTQKDIKTILDQDKSRVLLDYLCFKLP